ncbi:hypothetical protein PVAP13_8NG106000 [Panicum virgatum]|uniref:Uncharacterized protein n=1 Tax=Panicum virgatum TaxID=38727 RepID=A0A8T0PBH0_PANVG|nr:hypothetical protein PVAP13_8NG106000 [Panicum virgatum]
MSHRSKREIAPPTPQALPPSVPWWSGAVKPGVAFPPSGEAMAVPSGGVAFPPFGEAMAVPPGWWRAPPLQNNSFGSPTPRMELGWVLYQHQMAKAVKIHPTIH